MKSQCQAQRLSSGQCSRRASVRTGYNGHIQLCRQHYVRYVRYCVDNNTLPKPLDVKKSKRKKLGLQLVKTGIKLLLRSGQIESGGRILVTNSVTGDFDIIRAGDHARSMMSKIQIERID